MSRLSTSSFELTPNERVLGGRVPVAAIAFLVALIGIESMLWTYHEWFADLAAWQWETKQTLIRTGQLDGQVAILGTSVLFHGLDPTVANAQLGGTPRVVNLALNGMEWQHETQLLQDRLQAAQPPSVVAIEFREEAVEQDSWLRGPYFRQWASWSEFAQSRFYYWEPSLALPFVSSRILASYNYRDALNNWIFESLSQRSLVRQTRDRNAGLVVEMQERAGSVRAPDFEALTEPRRQVTRPRPWPEDRAGPLWVDRFMGLAAAHHVRVVLIVPPAPPYLTDPPGGSGFQAHLESAIADLKTRFPGLGLDAFRPAGYERTEFADDLHLNARGREHLSREFATWLTAYLAR